MTAAVGGSTDAPLFDTAVMVLIDSLTPGPVVRALLAAGTLAAKFGATVGAHVAGTTIPAPSFSNVFYKPVTDRRIEDPLSFQREHVERKLVILTDQQLGASLGDDLKCVARCIVSVSTGLDRFGARIPETEYSLLLYSGLLDLIGRHGHAPRPFGGNQISHACGMAVFTAIAAGVTAAHRQHFLVSAVDVGAWINWKGVLAQAITGQPISREGGRGPWPILACTDGFLAVIYEERDWPRLVDAIGDDRLTHLRMANTLERLPQLEKIWEIVEQWTSRRSRQEAFKILQKQGIPVGMVISAPELLRDPELIGSGFVRAPADTQPTLAAPMRWNDIRFDDMHGNAPLQPRSATANADQATAGSGPLHGIRVVDCGIITAGAATSAVLGDLGADIIKIESTRYADPFRLWFGDDSTAKTESSAFDCNNRGKKGLGLDLKTPEGRGIFLRLVAQADVVVENFRRGVMDRLGLDYQALKAANPRIILASISANGSDGEHRGISAYGSTLEALGGLAWSTRDENGNPLISGRNLNFPDQAVALVAAGAIAAAVRKARCNGEGAHLDISQREVTIFNSGDLVLGGALADTQFEECFEARDAWVAIQCARFKDKSSLAQCLGLHADDVPSIYRWMRERTASEIIPRLESLGIFGARVPRSDQLLDAYMREEGPFCRTTSGRLVRGIPFRREGDDARELTDAPTLGQHTRQILGELLSIPDYEIDRMANLGIVDVQVNDVPTHQQPA
jgi:crotonobetainyl-CoA:carnitine CoA-transferase CaiB-like acyl-CoA transferase